MQTPAKKFLQAQRGFAAIEFAFLAPLLITLMLGSVELQRYMRIERRLSLSAENIAGLVAQRQATDTNIVNVEFNAAIQLFPPASAEPPRPWYQVLVHQISSVSFTPTVAGCTANCTYTAKTNWIWPSYDVGIGLGNMRRTCGAVAAASTGDPLTGANLPAAAFGPGSLIVVDLRYRFQPLFGSNIVPTIDLTRTAYANARFAYPFVPVPKSFDTGHTTVCP